MEMIFFYKLNCFSEMMDSYPTNVLIGQTQLETRNEGKNRTEDGFGKSLGSGESQSNTLFSMFLCSAMQDEERPRVGPCLLPWKQRWPCLVSPLDKELQAGGALQEALIIQYLLTEKWGEGVFALLRLPSGLGSPLFPELSIAPQHNTGWR